MMVGAALLAGGLGRRLGGKPGGAPPKQFMPILGRPMLLWALDALLASGVADSAVLVVPEGFIREGRRLLEEAGLSVPVIAGGDSRQASSLAALRHFGEEIDIFLTHDAARPFVTPGLFQAVAAAAAEHGAAIAARPASDTVKLAGSGGFVEKTLPRERLWTVQTPQAFEAKLIRRGHERALADGFETTDDAALVERLGAMVALVEGTPENIKVTTLEDFAVAEALAPKVLERRGMRHDGGRG